MKNNSNCGVVVGLVSGRHEMPVNEYIFESIENVLDFDVMNNHIAEFLKARKLQSGDMLVVYVTGLTAATAALVHHCTKAGVYLILMHYDRDAGDYKPQVLT